MVPDGPPLAVPVPPARVITPVEEIAAAPPPAVSLEPVTAEPTPPRQPVRPEPKPGTPPPAAAPAQSPPPPPAPIVEPREVRTVPSAAAADEERKIKERMAGAARDLNRVDYQKLSAEGKAQYDQSMRFSEQAQQALKERNFVYALTLADKAATLAAELPAGR